eukprot:TRINITY_DN3351_c0_g1_i1.p1 TRINITY_DN3351_c0_g1~~TRINITY_DN3351_c0_g1_i1.p1  ORF type:complete len:326 (+),score=38.61 TRINITY_DN3351_c0_g1_i1:27-1004(+)
MSLITITSEQDFDYLLADSSQVVAYFWASWCEPCKHMEVVVQQLAQDNQSVKFAKIEAEKIDQLTQKYAVGVVPYYVLIKDGKVVNRVEGADAVKLTKAIEGSFQSVDGKDQKQDLQEKIKTLLSSAQVLLFMKGSPQEPKCGFSRKVVDALNQDNIQFQHFDILQDEEIRQGLKEYSQWPTYPQLYVCGDLIGGCDIILELKQNNELKQTINDSISEKNKPGINQRIRNIVDSSPIVLFMKGSPGAPQCGFSSKVVNALNAINVQYAHFDILTDEDIRQGLKTFSNWPTFPQLYVKGQLMGGCDIVLELEKSGELKSEIDLALK